MPHRCDVTSCAEHQPRLPLSQQVWYPENQSPKKYNGLSIIIRLSAILSREDIATYTNVSLRKVNDVLSTFNKEGTVKVYTRQKPDRPDTLFKS